MGAVTLAISPLLTLAGAAVGSLTLRAADTLAETFADVLRGATTDLEREQGLDDASSGDLLESAGVHSRPKIGTQSPDDLRRQADAILERFRRLVNQRFAQAGIDTLRPIQLEVDPTGGVRVIGDHPDTLRIDQLFAEDPDLISLLNDLASTVQLLRAADQRRAIQEYLAQNPSAAAAGLANRLAPGPTDSFHLTFDRKHVEVSFE